MAPDVARYVALLVVLLVADGAFCGLRAVRGRTGRLRIANLVARGMGAGAVVGGLGAALIVGIGIAALGWPPTRAEALTVALGVLVLGYGGLASAIGVGYLALLVPSIDVRSLASVVVFGPVTLARPAVIVGVAALGAWRGQDPVVAGIVLVAPLVALAAAAAIDALGPALVRSDGRG